MADTDPLSTSRNIEDAVPMAKTLGIRTVSASKDEIDSMVEVPTDPGGRLA